MDKKVKIKAPKNKGVSRVPLIMQMQALECGAACLAMVLAYYEKWVALDMVRKDCSVSRDGSNAQNMLKAARNYGLNVQAYRFETNDIRQEGIFPCIIHWNFNHFVVLCGFSGKHAIINDPSRGVISISLEEFDRGFTGVTLILEPSENFRPEGKQKSVKHFALKRLKGNWLAFIFMVITSAIGLIIGFINPAFSRVFLDKLLSGENGNWLYPFMVIISIVTVISLTVDFISKIYLRKVSGKIAVMDNSRFIWHVLRLPIDFFAKRKTGELLQRYDSNNGIADTLIRLFAPLIINLVTIFLYLFVIINYSFVLTAIGLASILINIFMAHIISQKRINLTRVGSKNRAGVAGTTAAGIEMIESIKSSGAENGYFCRYAGQHALYNANKIQINDFNAFSGFFPELVSNLMSLSILAIGVYLTITGSFTVGMILAFQGYMTSFLSPAVSLISAGQTLQEMRSNMEEVEDVLLYPTDVNIDSGVEDGKSYDKLSGNIELKNVSFGYSKTNKPLIEDLSISIKSGSKVAFVGASACGKSTITKLISGLYPIWSGEILFDGKTKNEICRAVFTASVAVVDQEIVLFDDTIANNIKMWDNAIEDYEMIMAARDAQLHYDIMQRENGYDYKLTEGGKDLSGGQRQRLEIARVLAQDPTIIIMDEATSALDAKTEYDIVKSINDRGITCIIVAHRLSTIRDCDQIYVMDNGKIAEQGTHDELMLKNGLYTRLVVNE